jgi:hypothetical protein
LLVILTAAFCGCGSGDAPTRAIVVGEIKHAGQPVVEGTIRFIPAKGPSTQGFIKDGRYRIDQKGGVAVGENKVEIESYVESGQGKENVGSAIAEVKAKQAANISSAKQVLPDKYNTQTRLKFVVETGQENDFSIDLE